MDQITASTTLYFKLHSQVHSSLSKATNGLLYQEECNIVDKICEDNFDAFNL